MLSNGVQKCQRLEYKDKDLHTKIALIKMVLFNAVMFLVIHRHFLQFQKHEEKPMFHEISLH